MTPHRTPNTRSFPFPASRPPWLAPIRFASRRGVCLAFTLGIIGACLSEPVWAQANPGSMPLGGRSTLMGGTGVALGRDGASPFLNPATMNRISDTRLAFSVRFYRYTRATIEQLYRVPLARGQTHVEDIAQQSLSSVPSSFCAFITLSGLIPEEAAGLLKVVRGSSGRTKLGLCGATIEREEMSLSAAHRQLETNEGVTAANLDLERTWQRSSIGPSISYQMTDSLAVGASMSVVSTTALDRSSLSIVSASSAYDGQPAAFLHQTRASALDGMTTLGITYVWRSLTSGLSLRLPSVHFSDSLSATGFDQPPAAAASLRSGSGSFRAPLPPILTFGSGVDWSSTALEFDVATTFGSGLTFDGMLDEHSYSAGGTTLESRRLKSRIPGRSGVAFRLGGEWGFSESLSLLAGARYEPSRVTSSPTPYLLAPTDESFVGTSLGLGSYGRGTELLLGTELSYAWARIPISTPEVDGSGYLTTERHSWSALLVLSGSVGLSSVKQAWRNFDKLRHKRERAAPPKRSDDKGGDKPR